MKIHGRVTVIPALWLWNRLDEARWTSAKLALREKSRRKSSIEVDHIVAYDLWSGKLDTLHKRQPELQIEEFLSKVNELGNCMLLEKNFNISKSNAPLKAFLDGVHAFQERLDMTKWAAALDLDMEQVNSGETTVEVLQKLFSDRSQKFVAVLKDLFEERTFGWTLTEAEIQDDSLHRCRRNLSGAEQNH